MPSKNTPPGNLPGFPKENQEDTTERKEILGNTTRGDAKTTKESSHDDLKSYIENARTRDLLIVLLVFVLLVGVYIFSTLIIGPKNPQEDPFVNAGVDIPSYQLPSQFQGEISLNNGSAGDAIYPSREYVTITINKENLSYLYLTDWSLLTPDGKRHFLGKASYIPLQGEVNDVNDVIVNAGDVIVVSSGDSPIGVSFRQNTCSGYLEQFQNFFPPIQRQCPNFEGRIDDLGRTCRAYILALPECEAVVDPLPDYLSPVCKRFIQRQVTYNACVATYRGSPGFKGNVWRIFLDEDTQIWPATGTITLLDSKGRVVDQVEY